MRSNGCHHFSPGAIRESEVSHTRLAIVPHIDEAIIRLGSYTPLVAWMDNSYKFLPIPGKMRRKDLFSIRRGGVENSVCEKQSFSQSRERWKLDPKIDPPPRKFSKRSIQDRFWLKKPYIILGRPIWKWCQIRFLIPCCNPKRLFQIFWTLFLCIFSLLWGKWYYFHFRRVYQGYEFFWKLKNYTFLLWEAE